MAVRLRRRGRALGLVWRRITEPASSVLRLRSFVPARAACRPEAAPVARAPPWEPPSGPAGRQQQLPSADDAAGGKAPAHDADAGGHHALQEGPARLFGVELSPDTVAIALVYFVQGVLGLSRLAVSFFLKDDLGLDPAETAMLSGVSAIPWLIKPLDGLPLFGYRRRSYLVLCGLLGAVSWSALAFFVDNKYSAVALIFLSSLSVAFSDVVVDSMVVERSRGESQGMAGSLQSLCWGSSAAGGIISAYFSGSLVETFGTRFVFGVTAILPLMTSAVAALVREEPVKRSNTALQYGPASSSAIQNSAASAGEGRPNEDSELLTTIKTQLTYLWETIRQPTILLPTIFLFAWQATPQSDTAMFYFTTGKLHFGPEFLGRVRLVTSIASLLGVATFNAYLKEVPLRNLFFWTTITGAVLGSTQLLLVTGINRSLGISDQWFAVGDSLILGVLGQVSFMPVLVLSARLCPPGVEATLFATLMSISNGGGVTGGLVGGGLTHLLGITSANFDNLASLLVVCNLSSLLLLPFLGLLPTESDIEAAKGEAQELIESIERDKADS
eukprot:SM000010S04201  [mRNA]  locus=s10:280451:284029:+ [translate_table: standard]